MRAMFRNKIYLAYFILLLVTCTILVFTNFSYDAEYQISMAYRLLNGDDLITQMWEPHQTSAFLCAFVMKFYMTITRTTTGIIIFVQLMGLLLRALISFYVFYTVKQLIGQYSALVSGILYLLLSPKDLLVPEFSNMQLWFSTLTALTIIQYFHSKRTLFLVLSGISFCFGVFSYPSFILAYPAICYLLFRYSQQFKKAFGIFTGICVLIGGSFVIYLLAKVGLPLILECVPRAFSLEPTHTVNMWEKLFSHLCDLLQIAAVLASVCFAGFVTEIVFRLLSKLAKKQVLRFSKERVLLFSWFIILAIFLIDILRAKNTGYHAYPSVWLICLGLTGRKFLSREEQCVYDCGMFMGFANLIATLLLSDHGALRAVPYMVTSVCFSVIPLYHLFRTHFSLPQLRKLFVWSIHLFLLLIITRCIYIHVPIYGREQICSLSSDLAYIRSGPAMGLITDEAGAARQRDSMAEWKEYVRPGDTIWILGEPVDTLGYLYEDVEVGAPTVMSTPTYNENLLYYWELNPEKYPDIVILESSFGELSWVLSQNQWLLQWLDEKYKAETVKDGNYWRYYFKESP